MLLQEFLSRKKLSRKYRSIFGLKSWSCDRRNRTAFLFWIVISLFPGEAKNETSTQNRQPEDGWHSRSGARPAKGTPRATARHSQLALVLSRFPLFFFPLPFFFCPTGSIRIVRELDVSGCVKVSISGPRGQRCKIDEMWRRGKKS